MHMMAPIPSHLDALTETIIGAAFAPPLRGRGMSRTTDRSKRTKPAATRINADGHGWTRIRIETKSVFIRANPRSSVLRLEAGCT